ncbi:MAG: holliday junction resolvasome, helicase subunit [Pseudomonadales bacterium]|uniref:DUF2388 domain-containing protein n=1 Tax=Halopseudomonas TaxID=2901189 RepID=UPI000C3E24D7|nr:MULTISPECIES: DUF2388 domain-containing protein [Halopseudomonas]MAS66991.1 holliday junction resolvasome, helicase subunit [Pseudomonadales bacterium]MEE2800369.1 DUF2388 domain-containing protein [Pseudomonadota bacterium]MBP76197.1 holliday junction resolvasome, helicase subunit [Pseudomonadales bacterium]MDL2198562.1 DUF2388 domain-containing protein [Halopseudomonas aestusnigri]UGV31328.1 DUF2388 domain-containing protein [Halopseudomonas aestusnigri]
MKSRYLMVAASFSLAATASASSFIGTTDAIGSSLANSAESSSNVTTGGNDKVVLQARDDAASFVASDGAIRGVHLEAALAHLRARQPASLATDMQLAEDILAR